MQSTESRHSSGLMFGLLALFWECIPWLLTGALGVWQWHRLSARGEDMRHVVLVAVLLCVAAVLVTVFKTMQAQREAAAGREASDAR